MVSGAVMIFGVVKQKPEISQCSQVTSEAAVTLRESYRYVLEPDYMSRAGPVAM